MAQAEDTELRDLVIEALERNGSLAKIRALLRANIFLAFEDECENMKQNVNLDNVLKLPEGILALSVIHEFLEFCCLKNTLFVYMSESRQGSEYNYDGKKTLSERLNVSKTDILTEPILLTIIKNISRTHKKTLKSNNSNMKHHNKCVNENYEDDQNCTYILHEDSQSSTTSNSNSDNSSDEKNKLHLRLQLDNSDTDTSSDFAKDKSSSEYIPGDHILESNNMTGANIINKLSQKSIDCVDARTQNNLFTQVKADRNLSVLNSEFKLNSSSDSTSYMDLKPFSSIDEKMLNTAGLPIVEIDVKSPVSAHIQLEKNTQNDISSPKSAPVSLSPISNKDRAEISDNKSQSSVKSDDEAVDISYGDDFLSSSPSKIKDIVEKQLRASETHNAQEKGSNKVQSPVSAVDSPHEPSQTSRSTISLSDVADLISDKSSSGKGNKSIQSLSISKDNANNKLSKLYSDISGDFTESPVPSLSNLSLDIHSD